MNRDNSQKEKKVSIQITGRKLAAFLIIAAFWGASLWAMWRVAEKKILTRQSAQENTLYPLLNPRLRDLSKDERGAMVFSTLIPLREKLFALLGDKKNNSGFYVEDLNAGVWSGWREKDPFVGASLLKVPIALAVMKKIDNGEWTLEKTFALAEADKEKSFGDLWQDPDGKLMRVKDLLDEMLKNSDNTASNILFRNLTLAERDDVFEHIGLINPESEKEGASSESSYFRLTPRNLANLFRALYNATYLTRESSSYLLETLTETKFDNLVSDGEKKEFKVAHKIASFFDLEHQEVQEYHDCGIAFFPDHPYLYCFMTQAMSSEDSEKMIRGMGDEVYKHFAENKK